MAIPVLKTSKVNCKIECFITVCLIQHIAGIVPRFIRDLYERIEHKKANSSEQYDAQVFVSFLELYNEDLVDLLNMQQHRRRSNEISIREDVQGNIYWSGVREEPCHDPDELLGYLTKGSLCRTTGSTDMNAVSSRSHAIFSVILKQQLPPDADEEQQSTDNSRTIVSKFHFVDLAGSERVSKTTCHCQRKHVAHWLNHIAETHQCTR